ncbi:MAG TPA: CHAT domain-containing protein [Anaerolineae bacterium]
MIAPSPLTEDPLAFYHDLAARIRSERPAANALAAIVRSALETHPLSLDAIKRLRQAAEGLVWCAPRRGWALAHIAHAAGHEDDASLLQAESGLTLGIALGALGEFAEAIPLLERATERLLTHDQPGRAARCECELANLYATMGRLTPAETFLARAQPRLSQAREPVLNAYYHRAAGLMYFEKNQHQGAVAALRQAASTFAAHHQTGELALTACTLAEVLRYTDAEEALRWVEEARSISVPGDDTLHRARCDYTLALVYGELNRYTDSLKLFRQSRPAFIDEGLAHQVALCDVHQGIAHYRLNQFDEALNCFTQAREAFAARALESHVARCDFNLALTYYATNGYREALSLFQRVAESAPAEGRVLRAALCYNNMGLCFDRLGRYDQALRCFELAQPAFLDAGNWVFAAHYFENLAGTYRRLGRQSEAVQHFQKARDVFSQHGLHLDIARCDACLADLYLAQDNYSGAVECLERAREAYQQESMLVQVAGCDRERARALSKEGQSDRAHQLLDHARMIFVERGLLVDVALCDVARGEIYLNRRQAAEAVPFLQTALATLDPSFPDEAWRAQYALGQCALMQGNRTGALEHWLSAVQLTHQIRSTMPTERLSGGFFASRRLLYEQTLELALAQRQDEPALLVAEAGKSQMFLTWADDRSWRTVAGYNPHLGRLLDREEQLRQQLAILRGQLRLIQMDTGGPLLRGADDIRSDQPELLAQLAQLSHEYEDVIEQLRVQAPGWLNSQFPRPLSLQSFRQAAQRHLTTQWACLDYYRFDDKLVIFYLDSRRLHCIVKPLNNYDRKVLDQCTNPNRDVRELIYGDSTSVNVPLKHLYQLLIPAEVERLGTDELLIIAPHAQLHALPFHALHGANGPLANQVTTVVVPGLGALESLLHKSNATTSIEHMLALGLSDFGDEARPLLHAQDEIAVLQEVFGKRLKRLWETEATRETLMNLQQQNELAACDVVHFATHAVLDRMAPSQSSVLLHDDSLTYADILNLKLQAQLVVLSSCEGVLGQRYAGDEIVSLAQAFFFAGAHTVVASLWPVEDASTADFMHRFYSHLDTGASVSRSLRSAQCEMAAMGHSPYQWAPFVAVGLP